MLNPNIDLGQVITGAMIGIIGYFIKKEIGTLAERLDKHDSLIINLVSDVQRLIGMNVARTHWRKGDDE